MRISPANLSAFSQNSKPTKVGYIVYSVFFVKKFDVLIRDVRLVRYTDLTHLEANDIDDKSS